MVRWGRKAKNAGKADPWRAGAFITTIVLLALMAAAWAVPITGASIIGCWIAVAALLLVYVYASLTGKLRGPSRFAVSATLGIALFGVIYATLLRYHHGPLPDRIWGERLGRAFFLSAAVTATAGTFDQKLNDAMRVTAHLQIILLVGGTVGTAAWAGWQAVTGIRNTEDEVNETHEHIHFHGTNIERDIADLARRIDESHESSRDAAREAVNATLGDALGSLAGQLEQMNALLQRIAERVGAVPPPDSQR